MMRGLHSLSKSDYAGTEMNASFRRRRTPLMAALVASCTVSVAMAAEQTVPTEFNYDARGNLTSVKDPNLKIITIKPDSLNRPATVTQPAPKVGAAQPVVTTAFDLRDRVEKVTDPRGRPTSNVLFGLKDVLVKSPDTGMLDHAYESEDLLIYRSNNRSQFRTTSPDALGRPTTITYYDGSDPAVYKSLGKTILSYDSLVTITGSENYGQGRLTGVAEYNNTGRVAGTSFAYDLLGRVTRHCQTVGSALTCAAADTVTYRWGTAGTQKGHLAGMTYGSGRRVDYQYDTLGRISTITTQDSATSAVQTVVSNVQYQKLGINAGGDTLKAMSFGAVGSLSGQAYARGIDASGRIDAFTLGKSAYLLTRDQAGRITEIIDATNATTQPKSSYTYDDLNRLTGATLSSGSVYSYDYDANGNRTSAVVNGTDTPYRVSLGSNRLLAMYPTFLAYASPVFSHDSTGNVLQRDGVRESIKVQYDYDDRGESPFGRLVRSRGNGGLWTYTNASGGDWTYLHNRFGQRIRKTGVPFATTDAFGKPVSYTSANYVGSLDTIFQYDVSGHLIAEIDGANGKVKREYIWLGHTPVAVIAASASQFPLGTPAPNYVVARLHYIFTDHLNTPRLITDTEGYRRWEWELKSTEPFGNTPPNRSPETRASFANFDFQLRFPGQYADDESQTFYNHHRTYSPETGRYLQSDPIGLAGGLNTYAYANNNPLGVIDPSGLAPSGFCGQGVAYTLPNGMTSCGPPGLSIGDPSVWAVWTRGLAGSVVANASASFTPTTGDVRLYLGVGTGIGANSLKGASWMPGLGVSPLTGSYGNGTTSLGLACKTVVSFPGGMGYTSYESQNGSSFSFDVSSNPLASTRASGHVTVGPTVKFNLWKLIGTMVPVDTTDPTGGMLVR